MAQRNTRACLRQLQSLKIKKGDSVYSVASADNMNAIIGAILGIARGDTIGRGLNTLIRRGDSGIVISATTARESAGGLNLNMGFLLEDASTTEGDPPEVSNKVKIFDGKVNGEFPSGMGTNDYIFDLDNPEDADLYVGITFDPANLTITSRFIQENSSDDPPVNRITDINNGFIYWPIGFTFLDDDDTFTIYQQRLGDINFDFIYGAKNSIPALKVEEHEWIDASAAF